MNTLSLLTITVLATASTTVKNNHTIAKTLWLEARSEGIEGLTAVASVIQTRKVERRLSLEKVCLQRKQFSCWNRQKPEDITIRPCNAKEAEIWELCLLLERIMENGNFHPENKWNYYYNPDLCNPSWAKDLKNKKKIKQHMFGRL